MSEPYIGEIVLFAGNFAPRGWALCQGQLLSIAQNTALFSILGTTYGGNGQTTFALPDLRSRVPVGQGQGPGLSGYALGQQAGDEAVTLTVQQMPLHNHAVNASGDDTGASSKPSGKVPGPTSSNPYIPTSDGTQMNPGMIAGTGGNQPHPNIQPYTCLNYIIATQGVFPSRN